MSRRRKRRGNKSPAALDLAAQRRPQVEDFRRRCRAGLLTVLFTDIVGSTELKEAFGDHDGSALIQQHRLLVREVLSQFTESEEVETAGDSFLIVFVKPSDAVKFSLLLQHRLRSPTDEGAYPIKLRIGIHVGEVLIEEHAGEKPKELYGIQVDTCARVMALAQADQVLLTRAAFDNARSALKGEVLGTLGELQWLSHGWYTLKGIEEPIEVCEVGEVGHAHLRPPAEHASLPRPSAPSTSVQRSHHLGIHVIIAGVILLTFTVLKLLLHHTTQAEWLNHQAYLWMQSIVSNLHPGRELPLLVVDISDVKPVSENAASSGSQLDPKLEFTPRRRLLDLIRKIASFDPKAIGVDIDFSPEEDNEIAPDSFELYETCLGLTNSRQQNIPVFLGVRRAEALGPAKWLGNERYASLAASISRPAGMATQMPEEFVFGTGPQYSHRIRSLSKCLADASTHKAASLPTWLSWTAERVEAKPLAAEVPDLFIRKFYVDHSKRQQFEKQVIRLAATNDLAGPEIKSKLQGKLVLLGDAHSGKASDPVIVPGEPEPVPGVYVHACAAYTLVTNPLHAIKLPVGLLLSFLLSAGAIGLLYRICSCYSDHSDFTTIPLTILMTFVLLFAVFFLSARLMEAYRIMWLDVFAVAAVLIAECLAEIFIGTVNWPKIKEGFCGLFVVSPKEQH